MSFYKTKLKTAFILLFFYSSFYGQGKIDGIVAIVGKQTILHSDILQQAQMLAINKNIDPSSNKNRNIHSSDIKNKIKILNDWKWVL